MADTPGRWTPVTVDPVLSAITQAAVASTAAESGWLLVADGASLRVIAASGDDPGRLLGRTIPTDSGSAGYVMSSGQPLAVAPRGDDGRFDEGMAAVSGRRPSSVLAVPCSAEDGVVGVLELVDKMGGGSFSFDDVEIATMLADVAGVAIAQGGGRPPSVPSPAELSGELERLAVADPARYAAVASAVGALLAHG